MASIFDIDKQDLPKLSEVQLEQLIARLAEAEIAAHGQSCAFVHWSGSIHASDYGIDVHVRLPLAEFSCGYIQRPDTVFQSKIHKMPKAAILKEMAPGGELSAMLCEQAAKGGSYIIVSLADDCSPPMKKARLKAMRDAIENDPNANKLHLDFYDRSKLAQWVRQHASVMIWVKEQLGQALSGWQHYRAWSNPPKQSIDELILEPGVEISLPSDPSQKLSIAFALEPMRDLIRGTTKAVRITGLSGVGKTRIVQALFDPSVGAQALDKTLAIYTDTGDNPQPSATAMFERLVAEDRKAIMVLDNCPTELHSALASKVSAKDTDIRLITVEYDISNDKPQLTEVIHIEAVGPDIAELLIQRRFPPIGHSNARRIAQFSNGNARVSLAIAERVGEGENLARLSDDQLFNRLFDQRKGFDDNLREHAEVLALVYSFSIGDPSNGESELGILAELLDCTKRQLLRSIDKISNRHIVQKRSHWRAILPHAIANRLTASALETLSIEELKTTFEAAGRERMLMSFAHRLSMLHDNTKAKLIARSWLEENGLLGDLLKLYERGLRMLEYITPVCPELLLERIESQFDEMNSEATQFQYAALRAFVVKFLEWHAYKPINFERCCRLLIEMTSLETDHHQRPIREKIKGFFHVQYSGTHATLDQRLEILRECVYSGDSNRISLGFDLLSHSLKPGWSGPSHHSEFGSLPRDYGLQLNKDGYKQWFREFLNLSVQLGNCAKPHIEDRARQTLSAELRGLWHNKTARDLIINAAKQLNAHRCWTEGWRAVRSTIYYNYSRLRGASEPEPKPIPETLSHLEKLLEPKDLIPRIMTYALGGGNGFSELEDCIDEQVGSYEQKRKQLEEIAYDLGQDFAASDHDLSMLEHRLFSDKYMPYRAAFGKGLALDSIYPQALWDQLLNIFELSSEKLKNSTILKGFIEGADAKDEFLAQRLLDQCALHSELKHHLVNLHPWGKFTETDFDRCISLLDDPHINPYMYKSILWCDNYKKVPAGRITELALRLLDKPHGDSVILEAVSLLLHDKDPKLNPSNTDLIYIGLKAATQRIKRRHDFVGGSEDYNMTQVIQAALTSSINETEKQKWINTIFEVACNSFGHINGFDQSIQETAAIMPEAFLDRLFSGSDEELHRQLVFISYGSHGESLLTRIDIQTLIEWCQIKDDVRVWPAVATGINLWVEDSNKQETELSEQAVQLLEGSPDPEPVLKAFAERITPSSWSGSLAEAMQSRVDAIGKLKNHSNTQITSLAELIYVEASKWIEKQRIQEQHDDAQREQRFE